MADDRDAIAIDVTPVGQPPHYRKCVLGLIAERRRFGASAALAVAALVIADGHEACIGERTCKLAENGHAANDTVALV